MLIDIPDEIQQHLGGPQAIRCYIRDRVLPTVPAGVQAALRKAVEAGRLRSMPNCWLPSTKSQMPGIAIIGDALNMRHPVTGAGMTVALKDVILLSRMLSSTDLHDTAAVLTKMKQFHWQRKSHSASLNIIAQTIYALFSSRGKLFNITRCGRST